jgi:outer membrane protein insertion porin family
VKPNDAYAQRFVDVDKNKIIAQYGELGRINAVVNPLTRSFEQPGYIDLVYEINEDRPYRIGRIHVRINGDHPHTKESAVLTKLTFKPGELASKAKIEKSKLRLKGSGLFAGGNPGQSQNQQGASPPEIILRPSELPTPRYFKTQGQVNVVRGQEEAQNGRRTGASKPAQVASQEPSVFRGQNSGNTPFDELPFGDSQEGPPPEPQVEEEPAYIDALVNVFETQTGRLNMGLGVNSNAGLQGNITLEENNFDILRPPTSLQEIIDGTAWRGGGQQFRIEAMPGLLFSRYLVSWRDPFFLDQNIMLGTSGYYNNRYFLNWSERREGGKVTLGHQFNPNFSGTVTMRAEGVNISNPSIPIPPDYQAVLGENFLSTALAALVYDTRDHPMMPGSGHYIQGSVEQGIANFVYQKYDIDARKHFLIKERPDGGSRHILSFYGNVGYIEGGAPFFERFFAGGFGMGSTFRGFQYQGVGPRVDGVRIGGQFQALGTIEYQIPITADNTIQVVTFTDLGTVDSTATFTNYRQTVGAGLRLMVPMLGPVPIAVDFGIPIRHVPGDSLNVVSFNMSGAR